jgi:phosphomannomutase / phosphoglucomutase
MPLLAYNYGVFFVYLCQRGFGMVEVSSGIFKKYDIRGVAVGEKAVLGKEIAHAIGQGIGTYLQRIHHVKRIVVGRDNRTTSPELQSGLMDGLVQVGCEVIDIGLVSTPLVYWHAVNEGDSGGIMVTGSHLAPQYNGFKLSVGAKNIYDKEIKAIQALVQSGDFDHAQGTHHTKETSHSDFIADLQPRITLKNQYKIVVDAGNGTGGLFAPSVLKAWGQNDVSGIFLEPDGTYPNHAPNPQEPENMHDLSAKVLELGANIGFAFDGDADRVGVVDEHGRVVVADRLLALLARDMLQRHPHSAVVGEVLCSQVLFDAIKTFGGVPYMAPSGHSIVKDTMREKGALLGGEMSGHIFLAEDYHGSDDAYLVMGRVLQLIDNSGKTIGELDDELPRLFSTPEYRPHCPDSDKATVLAEMAKLLGDKGTVNTVDGVRVEFEKGWGIVRASNTEPVLSLRFEGQTEADALSYRQLFMDALASFPQVAKLV